MQELQVGRRDYAERRTARIARLEARANKLRGESASRLGVADRIAIGIPFGQPILVGHHSEKRHRKDLERMTTNTRRGIAAAREAEACDRRAASAESSHVISSDDPEAVAKLNAKLERLLATQDRMKLVNGLIRKHAKAGAEAIKAALLGAGISAGDTAVALAPDCFGKLGFPGYALSGGTAEMARVRKRIAEIEARAAVPETELTFGDVRVVLADNRVQIHFPGKPDEALRKELKQNGFKWAPSVGAWQRMASPQAWHEARRIVAPPAR